MVKKPKRSADTDALAQRLAIAEAQRAALYDALKAVLAGIPSEFAKPETQAIRMAARALLVEVAR